MILGFASLVLGIAAASVSRTIAAAMAAGRAAGAAFARGWGRASAGMRAGWARAMAGMGATWGRFMSRILGSAWFTAMRGHGRRLARSIGAGLASAGGALASGLGSAISAAAANPGVVAAGAAIGTILGPAIGAALGAAITAAVGIGVMAAGIAIAAKQSDVVQKAFAQTFKPIGKEISDFAVMAFQGPLVESAARFKQAWVQVGPAVKSALAQSAEFVKPLTEGVAQMFENAVGGGGFKKLLDAAGPLMNQLSTHLSRLGDAFDNMFESISSGGNGLAKGMTVIFALLSAAIVALGNTIEFLSKAFDKGTNVAESYAQVMAKMLGWLPGIGDLWQAAAEKLNLFNDSAGKTRDIMPIAGSASAQAASGIDMTAEAAEKARKALYDLTEKVYGLISAQLGADQALAAFRRALMGVADAVKENGTSTQQYTKAGEANIQMVQEMVGLALQARDAAIKLAGGEKASEAAVRAANSAFSAQIAQLEATLRKAGFTQAQIDSLLGSYRNLANAPNIQKTVSVTHTTYYKTVGSIPKNERVGPAGSANIAGYAGGTKSAPPGWAWVGEEGAELMRLHGGEEILPTGQSARLADSWARKSKADMSGLRSAGTAVLDRPATQVKVYIGNEEFKGYVVEVADERANARTETLARRLTGH